MAVLRGLEGEMLPAVVNEPIGGGLVMAPGPPEGRLMSVMGRPSENCAAEKESFRELSVEGSTETPAG